MKKIILFLVMAIMTTTFNAQNLLSFRLGLDKSFETGSAMSYGPGASFQHGLSENLVIDLSSGLGYGMSLESGGGGAFGIKPVLSIGYKLGGS